MHAILLVEFQIDPAHVDAFAAAIHLNAALSLQDEAGCLRFDVCRDPADAGRFLLYEIYEDAAAVQAHLDAAHFKDFDALSRSWVRGKTVQRLLLSATDGATA